MNESKKRKNAEYQDGELEVILSMAPTDSNILWLSTLLQRSKAAIEIVYRIAYGYGPFAANATIQERKIFEAKRRVRIRIGRKRPRQPARD